MQRLAYIPPLGPVGAASTTHAAQLVLAGRSRSASAPSMPSRRRRKKRTSSRKRTSVRKRTSSRKRSSRKRLVKGSAAAKRFMARLRAKRRK